ncbi:MAG: HAD family hydrolase [Acidimicrobiales bacterium]|jgi:hypothetical protein
MILVSFDIDGTLEVGDPPGPVTFEMVHRARELGYVIGSASDRTRRDQQQLWDNNNIKVDFVSHKHHLHEIRAQFECVRYHHIGDTIVDELYAKRAGFEFTLVDHLPAMGAPGWIL